MKINLTEFSSQSVETSGIAAKKMRLSEHAQSMVFQMFTKNVYSNPIGTIVREITSNCFDSHVEAGVTDTPVVIRKSVDNETDTHYISFIDFGVGMSPHRVENIYGVYFESTKRVDNEQIGGWGIGAKSVLSYKRSTGLGEGEYDNSFYVITNFDGRKYVYMVYEGSESPEIAPLHEEPTTEGNGTEIRIPVLKKDVETFAREMQRQLYYFENIVFEGFDDYSRYVENDYQILQAKSFFFRGTSYDSAIHVCLGRVAYPIDYSALGLDGYNYRIPIALKLNVGDIGVTVSRESLDYSEKTIKVLKEKLELAKQEIVSMLSKQYDNVVTLEDYFEVKNNFGVLKLAGKDINLSNFIDKKSVNFENFMFKDLDLVDFPQHKNLYNALFENKRYGTKEPVYSSTFSGGYDDLKKYNEKLYFVDGFFNRKVIKQSYLKSKHQRYYIISKRDLRNQSVLYTLANLFGKNVSDLVEIDATTNERSTTPFYERLLQVRDEYFAIIQKHCTDYDTLEVPDEFVVSRKREKLDANVLKSSIPIKFMGGYSKTRVQVKDLVDFNRTIFYGTMEDEYDLNVAHRLFKSLFNADDIITNYGSYYYNRNNKTSFDMTNKRGIMFVMVAKNNMKIFQHCKKAYHVSEFKHKMLYRKEDLIMNYYNVDVLLNKYDEINRFYKSKNLAYINQEWSDFAQQVKFDIERIPAIVKKTEFKYLSNELGKYFDLSKAKSVDKNLLERVEKLNKLDETNTKIFEYIRMSYGGEYLSTEPLLVEILKKVMIFDI